MKYSDAIDFFPSFEKFVFDNIDNATYVAIVKKDVSNPDNDDYYFEVRHGSKTINIGAPSLFRNKKFNEIVNQFPIKKEDFDIDYDDNITLQNRTCKNNYNPFLSKLEQPNGGCSIANNKFMYLSGTLGASFKLKNQNSIFFISNFHVLADFNSDRFETIMHPSNHDVNTLKPYIEYNPIGTLYWYCIDDYIDAAIAVANCNSKINSGIRASNNLSIKSIIKPKIGMNVIKCGRTSGLSKGVIRSTICSVMIKDKRITNNSSGYRIFKNQILTNCMSLPGDSGSLLMTDDGHPLGLTFAGNQKTASFHNNLQYIFDKPKIFCNARSMPPIKLDKFL
ncbi:hypothetical protein [Flavivirga spongiicola]|uniref:S1 family peptidase n=1 Tax=Flavivirga spongiicola TaxID=421621 RepID=A0ABU7XP90_9FLAO|nr:hypothetical protein [Flavivirga sp. MEBiC05379]MDO5977589.1 hypothetical protein [Flavivirga sp. MEBiC05379]